MFRIIRIWEQLRAPMAAQVLCCSSDFASSGVPGDGLVALEAVERTDRADNSLQHLASSNLSALDALVGNIQLYSIEDEDVGQFGSNEQGAVGGTEVTCNDLGSDFEANEGFESRIFSSLDYLDDLDWQQRGVCDLIWGTWYIYEWLKVFWQR